MGRLERADGPEHRGIQMSDQDVAQRLINDAEVIFIVFGTSAELHHSHPSLNRNTDGKGIKYCTEAHRTPL
jgi:hypothetical protein